MSVGSIGGSPVFMRVLRARGAPGEREGRDKDAPNAIVAEGTRKLGANREVGMKPYLA